MILIIFFYSIVLLFLFCNYFSVYYHQILLILSLALHLLFIIFMVSVSNYFNYFIGMKCFHYVLSI
jgi:hypothetical protein